MAVGNSLILVGSVSLVTKALSNIVLKEQPGPIMQLKEVEKPKPKEVIQTKS